MPIDGDANNNTLYGTTGDDVINGFAGNDRIYGSIGTDQVDGGDGFDRLTFDVADANFFTAPTGSRTYTLTSTTVADSSGSLNTSFTGIEVLVLNLAGSGDFGDTIDASGFTSTSDDNFLLRIFAGDGDDTITGSAESDYIFAGFGQNTIDAGAGWDFVNVDVAVTTGETVYVTASAGVVQTTQGNVVTNSITNAEEVWVRGTNATGPVTIDASGLTGFTGILYLGDNNGTDVLIGSAGRDVFANVDNYTLGNDVYTGNGGADVYDYTYAVGAMDGDTITDFDADDVIDLRFNNATDNGSGLLADQFIGAAPFSGVAGQYRYFVSGGQTFLEVDTDGDGVANETLTIANGEFGLVETAPGSAILMRANLVTDADGDNFSVGTTGNDVVNALAGDDFIAATSGIDFVDGGDGNDQINLIMSNAGRFAAATGSRTYTLTADRLTDSSGTLNTSFTGVERIFLRTDNNGDFGDTIDASGLTPASSGTTLLLRAGAGDDTIIGSAGSDDISGGLGINTIDAGGGQDTVTLLSDSSAGTVFVTMSGGALITTINGVQTNSVINAEVVFIASSDFNAPLTTVDASGLIGFAGTVLFYDSNGSNVSIGSGGGDIFANVDGAEAGNDVYTGNGGADVYDYTYAVGAMDGDTITDFDADDVIDLRFNDSSLATSGYETAEHFIGNAAFSGTVGEYRYDVIGTQTVVQVDTDGDAEADETLTIENGAFTLAETAEGSNVLQIAPNSITGDANNNTLTGTAGDDIINAFDGNDSIYGSSGTDQVDGGVGFDRLRFSPSDTNLFASPTGSRTYTITASSVTDSSGAIDTSFVGIETVRLDLTGAGDFNDTIDASAFVSSFDNGFALAIYAGNGDDTITGSAESDYISTGFGQNSVDAGAGSDFVRLDVQVATGESVYVTASGGAVQTTQGSVITNTVVNAEEVWVRGTNASGPVTVDASGLTGFTGILYLGDNNGTDVLIGSAGAEVFANEDNHTRGNDVYTGNGGADVYDYTYAVDAMDGDTIIDFDADDVIDLRFNDSSLATSGYETAEHFIGNAAFSGTVGEYRYDVIGNQTVVQVDTDGDAVADETLTIADGAFTLVETEAGSNILQIFGNRVFGDANVNSLTGTSGVDLIDGRSGADTMTGLAGDDIYYVDASGDRVKEATGAGTDRVYSRVSYTLGANVEMLTLMGVNAINGTGNGLGNTLIGNALNNTLDGAGGADSMSGLAGDDSYYVNSAGDSVIETAGQGTDLVHSTVSHTLAANVEDLTLVGASSINATGNGLSNSLVGNSGNNRLNGAGGADSMSGGGGNDTYYVNVSGDSIVEAAGAGSDHVNSSISYTLGANVENLTLTGTAGISGTGNGLGNIVAGNSGANTLSGGGGNDTLNGGTNSDTMVGGTGNDTYLVDNAGDVVTELSSQGSDLVQSRISFTLGNNVEKLTLTGTGAISGTGNTLANTITGNGGANVLRGLGGADAIEGGSGSDDIYGGTGNDRLSGGAGNDDFFFDTAPSASTNADKITDFSARYDSIKLDLSVFSGITAAGTLAAGAFRLGTAAADQDDRIIYDSATGKIYYDADGIGAGAKVLFAQVTAGTTLTNADFIAVAAATTSRMTSAEKDSSSEWQASELFSSHADSVLPEGEFFEPAHILDQQQWSQMQHASAPLDWNSADYFTA